MQKFEQNLAASIAGALRPLAGASVTVTDNVTSLPASLYSDNGVTPLAQPVITDDTGYIGFYAADGKYTATFSGERFETFTRQILLEDPNDDPFATVRELAAASGAASIGYLPEGEDAQRRSVAGALDERPTLGELAAPPAAALIGTADGATVQDKLDALEAKPEYELPAATAESLGGVVIGSGLVVEDGVLRTAGGAGTGTVSAVNGTGPDGTGNVLISTSAINEGSNQYFTAARVRSAALTGLSVATNAVITAADTVLSAPGKLQKQITDLKDAAATFVAGKLGLRNVAGTFTSLLSNTNTAIRNYLLPDKDGTIAMLSDIPSGGVELLHTRTLAAAVAQIDIFGSSNGFTSAHDNYLITVQGLRGSAVSILQFQAISAASVLIADSIYGLLGAGGETVGTGSAAVSLRNGSSTNSRYSATEGCPGLCLELIGTNSTTESKTLNVRGAFFNGGGTGIQEIVQGSAVIKTTQALGGFRLSMLSGTIQAGCVIRVYGYRV